MPFEPGQHSSLGSLIYNVWRNIKLKKKIKLEVKKENSCALLYIASTGPLWKTNVNDDV